jgi:hypothetical protein
MHQTTHDLDFYEAIYIILIFSNFLLSLYYSMTHEILSGAIMISFTF